jgi:hypothetical protein
MIPHELESALLSDKHNGWKQRHSQFPPVLAQWEMVATTASKQHEQSRVERDWNEGYYVLVGDGLMDHSEVEIVSVKSQ